MFLRPDGTINTELMWDLLHPSPAGAEAWAQAIEPTLARLMGDPLLRQRMGEAGRRYAQQNFGIDEMLDKMEHVFRSVSSR